MEQQKFIRQCPQCDTTLYHKRKKDKNYSEKRKIICKSCSDKNQAEKYGYFPKEEFICFSCKKPFMEWRSQFTNPEMPFCSKQCWMNNGTKNLVDQKFGKLSVLTRERKDNITFYNCKCDCGNSITTSHANLQSGSSKSCGCLQKELLIKRCERPLEIVASSQIFNYYRRNANDRNLDWKLSKKDVLNIVIKPCFYCGIEGGTTTKVRSYKRNKSLSSDNEGKTFKNNGIDRYDNSVGYTLENCVPCCKYCNFAKRDMSFDNFKIWANRLSKNLNER